MAERLGELEEQAEDILSDAQLEIVEAFKPCLVPPRDLRDPEAVGQAGRDTGGEERLLEAVRRMPPELYAQRRPVLVARLLGAIEREKGALEPGTRQSLAGALGARLDEARALDGADFALRRAELAGALYPFDEDVVYHRGKRQAGKVAQFLLGPGAAGVLERWREAQVRQPAAGATPAASAAPGAEAPLAPLGRPAPPAQVNQTLLLQAAKLLRDPERRLEQPERAAFRARLLALAARPAGDPGARGEIEALIGELDARQATALSLSCRRRRVQFLARERGLRARDRADAFGLGEILVEADRLEAAGDLAGANAALNRAEELIASLAD